jgi:hypothetical protein
LNALEPLESASSGSEINMKFRMEKTLQFWVDVAFNHMKSDYPNFTKDQLFAHILQEYEQRGDAMRHVNAAGKIAWKPSPAFIGQLADAERDAQDDLEDGP